MVGKDGRDGGREGWQGRMAGRNRKGSRLLFSRDFRKFTFLADACKGGMMQNECICWSQQLSEVLEI